MTVETGETGGSGGGSLAGAAVAADRDAGYPSLGAANYGVVLLFLAYIFLTSFIGMAFGTSTQAAFTDFLFQDDGKVHYSLATMQAIFKPAGALLFWYCLSAYRKAMEEAGRWEVD